MSEIAKDIAYARYSLDDNQSAKVIDVQLKEIEAESTESITMESLLEAMAEYFR